MGGGSYSGMDFMGGRSKKGHQAQTRREERIKWLADPNTFNIYHKALLPTFLAAEEPGRMQASDAATIQGQNLSKQFEADLAGRGLLGSGAHLFGKQAIAGGTSAKINQSLIDFYINAMNRAADQAAMNQQLQVQGLAGTPIIPRTGTHAGNVPTSGSASVGGMG